MRKCKYSKTCPVYTSESYTCTKAKDKNYCGKYRTFEKNK